MVLIDLSGDYLTMKLGVLQGSVLGPPLFLICINDIGRYIKSLIFSDGTVLFSIVNDPVISVLLM